MALHGPGRRWKEAKEPEADLPRSHGQGVKALTVETGKAAFTDSICGPRLHTEIAHGIVWELFERNEIDGHSRCVGEEERVAVGCSARDGLVGQDARGARHVLDNNRLAKRTRYGREQDLKLQGARLRASSVVGRRDHRFGGFESQVATLC